MAPVAAALTAKPTAVFVPAAPCVASASALKTLPFVSRVPHRPPSAIAWRAVPLNIAFGSHLITRFAMINSLIGQSAAGNRHSENARRPDVGSGIWELPLAAHKWVVANADCLLPTASALYCSVRALSAASYRISAAHPAWRPVR